MTEKKFILVSLEDEKAKHLADVLGNKTCNKIIDLLAEKEASEQDVSQKLEIPLNTVEYNLKKLEKSGLIEKSKSFFWSKKGKKIAMYKLSNKSIIISPKKSNALSKIKSIVPAILLGGIGALLIKYLIKPVQETKLYATAQATEFAPTATTNFAGYIQSLPNWYWFSLGAVLAILIITILNWRKL